MKEGWTKKTLKEICQVINGRAYAKDEMLPKGKYRLLRVGNFFTNDSWYYSDLELEEDKYCDKGDLLYAWSASFGPKIWDGEKVIYHYHIWKMVCSNDIDKRFLYYWLDSDELKKQTMTNLHGTTMAHITKGIIEAAIVSFPPLSEQQRIVSRLDAAFAHIDELKANAEKQLSEARALFQKALTKAMEPKEGWEEKTLGEIADFVRGPFGGSLTKAMFKPSGYAVYEQQHAIHGHTKIRYFIDDRKYKEMERFSVEAGDLIMSCSGVTLGRVNLLPSNTPVGIINQALLKMRVKPIMNVLFFKYWLESTHFQEIIMKYSGGAAIPNVPAVKIIKEINISIPSSAEQQHIVSRLDSLSAHVRELEEVLQKTIAECDALKQAMLRKVFE